MRTRTSVLAHEYFQHNCGLPINATRMRQSLRYKYILCFRGNRTTHTSQHHCSFLLELITLRYQEDETYYLAASPIYAINQHFVGAVGLEPTRTRHQILLPLWFSPPLRNAWRILNICGLDSILTILKSCKLIITITALILLSVCFFNL